MQLWQQMELWQYIVVSVIALLVSVFIGISIAHLVIRFVFRDYRFPFSKVMLLLFRRNPGVAISGYKARQTIYKSSTPPKVRELTEFPMHELFAEFEHNRKIAAEFSGDNMLPLQTNVWNAHRYSSHELPADLLVEMQQIYADIELLNRLVWLATELGCQSSSLDDYKNLLVRIVEKINKIEEVVSSSGIVE